MINHNNFSAADIEQYWKGRLSPAEMHAMEKAAMDDPFLADALEGYGAGIRETAAASPENDIKDLQERLRRRVEKSSTRSIAGGWWKIAASVIVIAGGLWIYKAANNGSAKQEMATSQTAHTPKPAAATTDSTTTAGAANRGPGSTQAEITTGSTAIPPPAVRPTAPAASEIRRSMAVTPTTADKADADTHNYINPGTTSAAANAQPAAAFKTKTDTVQYNASAFARDDLAKKQKEFYGAQPRDKDTVAEYKVAIRGYLNSPLNTFNGQVLDKLNKPVPGASIEIPGRQQSFTTDSLGNFSFRSPDTALKVSVASVGFTQQYYTLRNSNPAKARFNSNNVNAGIGGNAGYYSNQIVLQPSNPALNEVVVVGYGARKKEVMSNRADMTVSVLDAEPVTGWDEFNDYIERNKKIPDGADEVHGSVVLRFNVDRDGSLKNFTVEKSLGQALDAEAIRLVKDGPAWHLLKGKSKKTKVTVMVRF